MFHDGALETFDLGTQRRRLVITERSTPASTAAPAWET